MIFLDPAEFADVLNFIMLCFCKIVQGGAGGNDPLRLALHPEPLQRCRPEVPEKQFVGKIEGEDPVLKSGDVKFIAEELCEFPAFVFLDNDFARFEALDQLVDILRVALGYIKLTGGDVQEGDSRYLLFKMNPGQEVILFPVEDLVMIRNTGGDQFGDPALHYGLCKFRIFQLITDGDPESGFHQFWEVQIEGMMWKTG